MVNAQDKTEKKTEEYFALKGTPITKIPETINKTPDCEGEKILVEVKKITPKYVEGMHKDPTYNAIKSDLQNAARKFRAYDPKHNKKHIVVIFSCDIIKEDIFSVWTGYLSPHDPIRPFKGGMLLSGNHKKYINEIIWFENVSDTKPRFIWYSEKVVPKT